MKTQKPYYITTEKISVGYDGKPLIEEVEIALRKGDREDGGCNDLQAGRPA
jgi:iron complex transport system ATP-binding protein